MPKALYREFDELACAEIISQYHLANYILNNTERQTHSTALRCCCGCDPRGRAVSAATHWKGLYGRPHTHARSLTPFASAVLVLVRLRLPASHTCQNSVRPRVARGP